MRFAPAVLVFSLTTSPVLAADCTTFVSANPEISVTNNMGAFLISGIVGGAVGVLASQVAKTPNSSQNELYLKEKLAHLDYYNVIKDVDLNVRKSDEFNVAEGPCKLMASLTSITLEYGSSTNANVTVNIEQFKSGILTANKIERLRLAIPAEPFPNKPTRRFKADKSGKMVEVTKPTLSRDEAYRVFEESFATQLRKSLVKLINKYKN